VMVTGPVVSAMATPGAAIAALMVVVTVMTMMGVMSLLLVVAHWIIGPVARLADTHAADRDRPCGSDDGEEL
jgi:nitrate/nitrite-specific signal transduction histidine kinase